MADNLNVLDAASVLKTVAADDIAGVKHMRQKVQFGTDGTATDVDADNGLPVEVVGPIDEVSSSLTTISHEHHEMHDGHHYFIKTYITNTGGAATSDYFSFTAPDTLDRIHARVGISPDVDFTVQIHEDATVSGGTPVPAQNCDRNSANAAVLAAVAAPTIDVSGNLIWDARNGGGKDPVGVAPGLNYEIIAKQASTYVFKITKNIAQAGVVDIDFWWYEELTA
jgi:hypothetical protein